MKQIGDDEIFIKLSKFKCSKSQPIHILYSHVNRNVDVKFPQKRRMFAEMNFYQKFMIKLVIFSR